MESLLTPATDKLDSRFETRTLPSGATIIVPRGEKAPSSAASSSSKPATGGASSASAAATAAPAKQYKVSELPLEERFKLVRSIGEECIQEEELMALLKIKPHPICYDGFEPSGRMHIAQGILKAINVSTRELHCTIVCCRCAPLLSDALTSIHRAPRSPLVQVNKLTASGCVFKFWVADWFALLNNKMGGDIKKIRTVGQYMIEVRGPRS
jgi:tyrosyl-tRNA synthetase